MRGFPAELKAPDEGANGATVPMRGGRLSSVAAVALALLASQHHNFMMLLLAFGLGDAAMSFMTAVPWIRGVMLAMSLAMVAVIVYQIRDARRSPSARVLGAISVVATSGLAVWSIARFGL